MAKNEAKIKFTAETGEFNDAIKESNTTMTELRAELKLNEAQMESTGKSVEGLKKKHSILKEQLSASEQKTEALNQKVKKAVEIYGENSQEASKLRTQLLNAQTAEERLRAEVDRCEKELKEQKETTIDVGEALKNFGGAVCTAAVAGIAAVSAAAVAAGKALVDMSVSGAAYADNIITASVQTGIATDKLQEYQYAAELIDVSTDTLTGSMAKQIKSMKSVQDGAKTMTSAYDQLGVKVTNADGTLRNSDDVYWEVIDALGKMENETERDALAMQILGKSAQDLNPLIESGSEKMAELGQQAHEAGYVLSGETLDAYGAFDDQLQYLNVGAEAAKNALGGVLLPTLTDLATDGNELLGEFTRGVNECGGDISGIGDVISELMPEVVNKIGEYLPQIADLALSIIGSLAGALIDNLPSITSVFGNIISYIVIALPSVVDGIMNAIPSIINAISEIAVQIIAVLPELITSIVSALPTLIPALIDGVVATIAALCANLPQIIQPIIVALPDVVIGIIDALIANLPILIEGVVQLVIGLVQALPTIIVALVDAVPTIVQLVVDALVQNVPMLIDAAITITTAVIQALPSIVMALVRALPDILQSVWNAIVTVFQSLPDWFGQLFDGVVSVIASVFPKAKEKVVMVGDSIKEFIGNTFTTIKTNAAKVWGGIKDAMVRPIQTARDTIKGIVDKVKGFFSGMKLEFPKIKMPHFSIKPSGWKISDLLQGEIPKLGIEWYAKAVDEPMVMAGPTIFGYNSATGNLMGGGETKSEMIGGTNTVMQMIQNAVDRSMQAMNLSELAAAIEDLANRPIELDINGRQFALATAGDSDRVNGMRNRIIERGVLLD